MSTEYDPVQLEAYKRNPNWSVAAHLIAGQPGCEGFPVDAVDQILAKPGELIVGAFPHQEGYFAIGAMIAAKEHPFSPISVSSQRRLIAIEIDAERKEYTPEHYMYAEREIGFGLTPDEPGDTSNWMAPGIHRRGAEPTMTILSADSPAPDLAIGTDDVNALFEELITDERFAPHKDRLVGMLFQVARLAIDFNAPTPTAPEELQPALSQAKVAYQAKIVLAQTMAEARKNIDTIENQLRNRSAIPRPAIHFEEPLDLPTLTDIVKIRKSLAWPPTDNAIRYALRSYREAVETLDALRND